MPPRSLEPFIQIAVSRRASTSPTPPVRGADAQPSDGLERALRKISCGRAEVLEVANRGRRHLLLHQPIKKFERAMGLEANSSITP